MQDTDPLEMWLVAGSHAPYPDMIAEQQAAAHTGLDHLQIWLDDSNPKRGHMPSLRVWGWSNIPPLPEDVERIKQLYIRVVETHGGGKNHVEEALLRLLAATEDPAHIPFWETILHINRPRDSFADRRRTFVCSALALIAIRQAEPEAFAVLSRALEYPNPRVRALAIYYLGRIHQGYSDLIALEEFDIGLLDDLDHPQADAGARAPDTSAELPTALQPPGAEPLGELDEPAPRPIPEPFAQRLLAIARDDKAFEPRFLARHILRLAGQPAPLDSPEGTFLFRATLLHHKQLICGTIELRADQTVEDLHMAIQELFGWDNDHLFSFFMNGRRWDQRYQFVSLWDDEGSDEGPIWANQVCIGDLGLIPKHKFSYLFDYGDQHECEIEVIGSHERAGTGPFPQITERQGKAPPQYPIYNE